MADRMGFEINARLLKDKFGGEKFEQAIVPFKFDGCIDMIETYVRVALEENIIEQKGAMYYYKTISFRGMNNVVTWFKENPKESMCFHLKSLLRQIRIYGNVVQVSDKEADEYYNSRAYGSRIGAWASNQSEVLESRKSLDDSIEKFKKKFHDEKKVPRPPNWSGWRLVPEEIEFWRDGDNRIHERLKYVKNNGKGWKRFLLNP